MILIIPTRQTNRNHWIEINPNLKQPQLNLNSNWEWQSNQLVHSTPLPTETFEALPDNLVSWFLVCNLILTQLERWPKSCRLCLLTVVFAAIDSLQFILYHVLAVSISCLNVIYLLPFFPHSVSNLWREQTSMRLVKLYQSLPSQTTPMR